MTEGQLRCLLTIYDYLGLDAGATIELLSYLKSEKGTVRTTDLRRSQSVGRYGHCHRAGGPAVPDTPRG
ncbi:MAG: hypothetical protein ACLUDF_03110 [Butyricicoccus sp.]